MNGVLEEGVLWESEGDNALGVGEREVEERIGVGGYLENGGGEDEELGQQVTQMGYLRWCDDALTRRRSQGM
jgi:hypothetical protein